MHTILSWGMGVKSTAILVRWLLEPDRTPSYRAMRHGYAEVEVSRSARLQKEAAQIGAALESTSATLANR